MLFSSSIFLVCFLPVFLVILYIADRRFRKGWILLASLFFYAWGAPRFVFVIAASVIIDFYFLRWMQERDGRARKLFFWASVTMNLLVLLYFKYMGFFIQQFGLLFGHSVAQLPAWVRLAIPLGISFITFQKLACTLDVYKRRFTFFGKFSDYAMYIFMFPQLLSGPIVRPGQIAEQIAARGGYETTNDRLTGFFRFAVGLAKKVLIADVLGEQVNEIFALNSLQLSSSLAWTGALAFTFEIYFDFSGYTDMAIGIARMMGFRLPENFNSPYVSTSITDFWRRWHITLGSWFRDYIFLPLAYATSRKMPREKYLGIRADKVIYLIATSVTFLLCGFWHGAAWTFILWGAYQGLFLILDRLFLLKILKKAGKTVSILFTFMITVFGWVLFHSPSLDYFRFYFRRMFSFTNADSDIWLHPKFLTIFGIAVFFAFIGGFSKIEEWQNKIYDKPATRTLVVFVILAMVLYIISLATMTSSGFSPFIYFRF